MEYSKKTILDYSIGDIVYYLLNNTTIVQGKFTKLETTIYNKDSRLNFYTLFTLQLANGYIVECDNQNYSKTIYESVNDVHENIRIITNSDFHKKEVYESKLKAILNKECIEYDDCGIYYYKTGAIIRRQTFNKVIWVNHNELQYEYTIFTKGGTFKKTYNITQCNANGIYATKEGALHNNDVEVITFAEPIPTPSSPPRVFDLNDVVYFLHFNEIKQGKITQVNTYKKFVDDKVKLEYCYCLQFKEDGSTSTCFVSNVYSTKEELINSLN